MKELALSTQRLTTVDIRNLQYPLSQTFMMWNFLFGPFSDFWAVSHLLSRTIKRGFQINHTVYFRHSSVNNLIVKTLFGSLFFLFLKHCSGSYISSVKRKLSVETLGEKWQVLRDLEKGLSNKTLLKNMVHPETSFQRGLNSKIFASLEKLWNKRKKTKKQWLRTSWPRMVELLQRFESLDLHEAARENNLAFWKRS